MSQTTLAGPAPRALPTGTAYGIIAAISFCHFCNDSLQSLLPSIYPNFQQLLNLSYTQIGFITLCYQIMASLLQPVVGWVSDKKPFPMALPLGTLFTFTGLLIISQAHAYLMLLAGALFLGTGSSIFHPEASRVARMAAGGRHGFSQSMFQVGGNFGSAAGPLVAALVIVRYGTSAIAYISLLALVACAVLWTVAVWYKNHGLARMRAGARNVGDFVVPRNIANMGIAILLVLIFSKYVYLVSLSNFLTFYLISKFGVTTQVAQLHLFAFLVATAVGTIAGGPLGDRFGRKYVIWFSILGTLPFALILPHASLALTLPLTMIIGFILASAFPAIVVFAQELVPNNVGMISGMFFGFAFGVAGLAAAILGFLADHIGLSAVYQICAFLPVIGMLAILLPRTREKAAA